MNNEMIMNEVKNRFAILKKMYHIMPTVEKEFFDKGTLYKSEFGGILYWLNDEEKALVKKIEDEKGIKVFHVVLSHTEFGNIYSMLYVSKHQDEWESDREELENGTPFVYAYNATDEWCSEFGCIGVCGRFGGMCRTA